MSIGPSPTPRPRRARLALLSLAVAVPAACGGPAAPPTTPTAPTAAHDADHGAAHGHDHRAGAMPHRFERADDWVAAFDDPARDAWQQPELVIAALRIAPGLTVADVGAGTGYFTVRLARAIPDGKIVATDIEPDMVRYLGERARREGLANVTAQLAGGDQPGLAPASVDRVLIVDVWHHIADRPRYAAGLAAALRPGGRIAIVDFTAEAHHGPPAKHRLTPEQIMADLRTAGLQASVSPVHLPEQYIVVAERP